jgi:hypothetical protein
VKNIKLLILGIFITVNWSSLQGACNYNTSERYICQWQSDRDESDAHDQLRYKKRESYWQMMYGMAPDEYHEL